MPTKRKKKSSLAARRNMKGYIFILPWFIGFVFLFARPLFSALRYSFYTITFKQPIEYTFAGLSYYQEAFIKDTNFLPNLGSALEAMLYEVPLILAFSLAIAYILNSDFIGVTAFKSIFFLPVIIASGIAITLIRGDAYASEITESVTTVGMFGGSSGMEAILIKANVPASIVSFIQEIIDTIFDLTWKSGIQILVFLAAFKSIPKSFYEASQIEGATGWESFCKITFPMISPMLLTNIVYTIIDTFTDQSNPVINYINSVMSSQSGKMDISYSSALSWIYFVIVFAIIMLVYWIVNRRVNYYNE